MFDKLIPIVALSLFQICALHIFFDARSAHETLGEIVSVGTILLLALIQVSIFCED